MSKITAVARYNITSKINNNVSEPELLFTGDDIAWFNPNSREIKFTTVKLEPFSLINNKIKFKSEIISEFEEMIDGKSKIRRYSCINKW